MQYTEEECRNRIREFKDKVAELRPKASFIRLRQERTEKMQTLQQKQLQAETSLIDSQVPHGYMKVTWPSGGTEEREYDQGKLVSRK